MQGERILYENSAELHACAGNVGHLDNAVRAFEATLGVQAPTALRYSWLSEADIPHWRYRHEGDAYLGGEAIGLHAWAKDPAEVHEVAHLVAGGDNVPPFFREGLAVALAETGGARGLRFLEKSPPDPRGYMTARNARDLDYLLAGVFVNFLLMRHGPTKFMGFYRSLSPPFTMKRVRNKFADAFGVPLDEEVGAFTNGGAPPCSALVFDLSPVECQGTQVEWADDTTWSIAADMDCDSSSVFGGDAPGGELWRWRDFTVEVESPGDYRLSLATPGIDSVRFGACFSCPVSAHETTLSGQSQANLRLSPGTHYIRVLGESQDSRPRVVLERL